MLSNLTAGCIDSPLAVCLSAQPGPAIVGHGMAAPPWTVTRAVQVKMNHKICGGVATWGSHLERPWQGLLKLP